ncbi:MAG: hypothetical protein JWP72_2022 [Massilia sp.]|jgi:hypothetical protein|nr:hypothetical protein [Massilia sp.]
MITCLGTPFFWEKVVKGWSEETTPQAIFYALPMTHGT